MHFRDVLSSSDVGLKLSIVSKTTSGCGVDETPTELALAVLTWELADAQDKLCLFIMFCLLLFWLFVSLHLHGCKRTK